MSSRLPSPPEFGAPLPPRASPDTLELLATRRSASAQQLGAPGPGEDELADLLRLAARVPDHGKMAPWRFVVLQGEGKAAFVERLRTLAAARPDAAKATAALGKIAAPPACVAVLSVPRHGGKPVWEQQASAAAACMTLLIAAQAMGYGANWISDWYGEDPEALRLLGADPAADPTPRLMGWIMLGTPLEPPLERARPDMAAVAVAWSEG
ncbi:MAG: nitroreductase [Caulobacteraceae bacterium]|nr:nitroreductase [Caulobacter sp.]